MLHWGCMNPNVAIISAVLAVLTLVLAIFGASWLNQRGMERLIDALAAEFRAEVKRLDQRLDSIEQRLDRIARQLEAIFKPMLPPRG
ncbi:MAG: hypothetical protein NZ823_14205 [Blastocatellia bacterium]|nr:hypothetical protein [Blastocatellia bacterium]